MVIPVVAMMVVMVNVKIKVAAVVVDQHVLGRIVVVVVMERVVQVVHTDGRIVATTHHHHVTTLARRCGRG